MNTVKVHVRPKNGEDLVPLIVPLFGSFEHFLVAEFLLYFFFCLHVILSLLFTTYCAAFLRLPLSATVVFILKTCTVLYVPFVFTVRSRIVK